MRNRSAVFVVRNHKILMEKIYFENRYFYTIPGGGIEGDETPEEAALRELKEECGLDGVIVRKLTELYNNERTEHIYEVKIPNNQEPILGSDPEFVGDDQPLRDVLWMDIKELSEKDRAFLFRYGLIEIDGFLEEVMSWGEEISYPGMN